MIYSQCAISWFLHFPFYCSKGLRSFPANEDHLSWLHFFYRGGKKKSVNSLQASTTFLPKGPVGTLSLWLAVIFMNFAAMQGYIYHALIKLSKRSLLHLLYTFLPNRIQFNILQCQHIVLPEQILLNVWLQQSLESRTGWDMLLWESGPYLTSSRLEGTVGQWPHCAVCTNHCCSKWRIDEVKKRNLDKQMGDVMN